jgi:hypothetical protein
LISAGGLGLVITLFSTTRGSRPRSRLLAEPLIIDSHRSPSSTSGSTPLIRAVPSRRIVPASSTPGSISSRSATAPRAGCRAEISDQRIAHPFLLSHSRRTSDPAIAPLGAGR